MVTTSQKRKAIVGHHGGLGTVVLVRHRIHSGGFRAYALHFVSVFGSAKAGIHRDKLGGGLKSTASLPAWSRDSLIIALRRQAPPVAKMHSKLRLWSASSLDGDEPHRGKFRLSPRH